MRMSTNQYKYSYNKFKRIEIIAALTWLVVLALLSFWPQQVGANGGTIIVYGDKGPFNVSLLASPSPPSPTVPIHLTLILTKSGTDNPVNDAVVIASPSMPGMDMPGVTPQRFIQAPSRPNMYDADIPVGMEGVWRLNVQVVSPQLGQTNFEVDLKVEKPSAPWGVIIGILVALPALAGITWWLLFRKENKLDEDEDE